jgi:hypothetical protein
LWEEGWTSRIFPRKIWKREGYGREKDIEERKYGREKNMEKRKVWKRKGYRRGKDIEEKYICHTV